jgi:hypothetical protein
VPLLCERLQGGRPLVRRLAAWALGEIAQTTPSAALRQALPALRKLSGFLSLDSEESVEVYRSAIGAIEQATRSLKDIPVPASGPDPVPGDLPLPASPADAGTDDLPLPASPEGPGPAPAGG